MALGCAPPAALWRPCAPWGGVLVPAVGVREFALATAFSGLGACPRDLAPLSSSPTWERAYSNGMIPSLLHVARGVWCGTLGMRQRLKPIGETRSKGFETVWVAQGM